MIEFFIVAFGVFLGIYASEWQNQKKVSENKNKSLRYILLELTNNKEKLQKSIKYHEIIKVNFDSIGKTLSEKDVLIPYFENKKFMHNRIKNWQGIGLPDLEDVAFEGAKIIGITQEIEIELINSISKAYKLQKVSSEYGKSILDRVVNINSSSKTIDVIASIRLLTTDYLTYEKLLLIQTEKTIAEIKKVPKA